MFLNLFISNLFFFEVIILFFFFTILCSLLFGVSGSDGDVGVRRWVRRWVRWGVGEVGVVRGITLVRGVLCVRSSLFVLVIRFIFIFMLFMTICQH